MSKRCTNIPGRPSWKSSGASISTCAFSSPTVCFSNMNIRGGLVTMSSLWRRSHVGHLYLQPMVNTSDQFWSVQIVILSPQATFGLFMHLSFDWSVLNGKLFWSDVSAKILSTNLQLLRIRCWRSFHQREYSRKKWSQDHLLGFSVT